VALLTTEGVSATAVNVDTVDGRVTLHGKVTTDAEKTKAGDVVAKIDGATEVRNLLQVVPAKNEKRVEASDEQITTHVKDAFQKDRTLAASNITVQSVNKGVVLLAGETPSTTTHLRAITAAAAVPGVRRVATEVKGGDQITDEELNQTTRDRIETGAAKTGDAMSDAWVTSADQAGAYSPTAIPRRSTSTSTPTTDA